MIQTSKLARVGIESRLVARHRDHIIQTKLNTPNHIVATSAIISKKKFPRQVSKVPIITT